MDLHAAAALATDLAREAGDFAVKEQELAQATHKGGGKDLVTCVDQEAERWLCQKIAENYPCHAILGEEHGHQGAAQGADYSWLIDQLDGTNNYVLGLDVYGVCLTLCENDVPVVAVVHDSPRRRTSWAISGHGAWFFADEERTPQSLTLGRPQSLTSATVAFLQGYEVSHDDEYRNAIFDRLERGVKRVLRTWAPAIDWGFMASGKLDGVVAYRNETWDLAGGVMIAQEAGAEVCVESAGDQVVVGDPSTVLELRDLLIQKQ